MTDTMNDATAAIEETGSDGLRVSWLGGTPPTALETAAAFGAPLPRGWAASVDELAIFDTCSHQVAAQLWPVARQPPTASVPPERPALPLLPPVLAMSPRREPRLPFRP